MSRLCVPCGLPGRLDLYYTEQSGRKQRVRASTALLVPPPGVECRDITS